MLSLCMIVKDEEAFIGNCLDSVKGLADEIIVVDTGSSDRTMEIAKEHGATVVTFPWIGDFSAARNAALSHAKGDWILALDADEMLEPSAHEKVRECIKSTSVWGYRVPICNYSNENNLSGYSTANNKEFSRGFSGFVLTRIVRLFRNKPEIRYKFAVHEGVEFSIEEHKGIFASAPFVIHHYGALRGKDSSAFKQETYFAMVKKDCEQYPNHPKPFYELGIGYIDVENLVQAKEAFQVAIKNDETYLIPYHYLGEIAWREGNLPEARKLFLKSLSFHPESEETYYLLGQLAVKMQDFNEARAHWSKALEKNPRSVKYFDALIQLHLAQKEPLQALALLYDASTNTSHQHFAREKERVEQQLVSEAKKILAQGPEKTALHTLVMIAYYRKEMKKVIALCNEAKKYFSGADGRAFDVFIEKAAASQESHHE